MCNLSLARPVSLDSSHPNARTRSIRRVSLKRFHGRGERMHKKRSEPRPALTYTTLRVFSVDLDRLGWSYCGCGVPDVRSALPSPASKMEAGQPMDEPLNPRLSVLRLRMPPQFRHYHQTGGMDSRR